MFDTPAFQLSLSKTCKQAIKKPSVNDEGLYQTFSC